MSNDDVIKQWATDLAAAYALSSQAKRDAAVAPAYKKMAANWIVPTPTPTPTPTPGNHSSFPFTMVNNPTGTQKTNPTVTNGDLVISKDGQVVDNVSVTGTIHVTANNVTVTNFFCGMLLQDPGKKGLTAMHGTIHGTGSNDGYDWNEAKIWYVEVTNTFDGFKGHGDCDFQWNWFHDDDFQTFSDGTYTHNDAVQVSSGNNVTISNNRVENWKGNSGFFIDPDQGTESGITISNNYITNTGNYPIYVQQSTSTTAFGLPDQVTITGNVIGIRRTDEDPTWGPMLSEVHATHLVWSNNTFGPTGQQILLDNNGIGYLAAAA